jgi:hypothetical protein
MSKKHNDPRGKQQGAQAHAEGEHGARTRERIREEIQAAGAPDRADTERRDRASAGEHPADGRHRLFEGRSQHDPADRASDQDRLAETVDEEKLDRSKVQTRHGAMAHPAMPDAETEVKAPHRR